MIKSEFAWMNGKLLPFAQATTHVSAFTLHYGVAVFEGIRCYRRDDGRSAVFRLREHVDRLVTSAKICDMAVPYSREQIEAACLDTLRANKLEEAYIRPLGLPWPRRPGARLTRQPSRAHRHRLPLGGVSGRRGPQQGHPRPPVHLCAWSPQPHHEQGQDLRSVREFRAGQA